MVLLAYVVVCKVNHLAFDANHSCQWLDNVKHSNLSHFNTKKFKLKRERFSSKARSAICIHVLHGRSCSLTRWPLTHSCCNLNKYHQVSSCVNPKYGTSVDTLSLWQPRAHIVYQYNVCTYVHCVCLIFPNIWSDYLLCNNNLMVSIHNEWVNPYNNINLSYLSPIISMTVDVEWSNECHQHLLVPSPGRL